MGGGCSSQSGLRHGKHANSTNSCAGPFFLVTLCSTTVTLGSHHTFLPTCITLAPTAIITLFCHHHRLIEDLDELDWSDSIKDMQRNWIGRSEVGVTKNEKKMRKMREGGRQGCVVCSCQFGCVHSQLVLPRSSLLTATQPHSLESHTFCHSYLCLALSLTQNQTTGC